MTQNGSVASRSFIPLYRKARPASGAGSRLRRLLCLAEPAVMQDAALGDHQEVAEH